MPYLFSFSCCSGISQSKNAEMVWHSLLPRILFCQNSPPWPTCLKWPWTSWLIVWFSYTRLWSIWSFWLVFCDCVFHSVCTLTDEGKRLVQASWWEGLSYTSNFSINLWLWQHFARFSVKTEIDVKQNSLSFNAFYWMFIIYKKIARHPQSKIYYHLSGSTQKIQ